MPGFRRRPQPGINNLPAIALQEFLKICAIVQFSQKPVYFYAHKKRFPLPIFHPPQTES